MNGQSTSNMMAFMMSSFGIQSSPNIMVKGIRKEKDNPILTI
jgi:hypothetical protein